VGELGQRFDDNKRVEGTIEEMLEGALNFLIKNMKNRVIIDPNTGKRKNIPEYPILALREAIANALIHRGYSSQTEGAYIQVYMYSDRIVIQNPGKLYGMNRMEKLGTDTIMEVRNPTIVRVLEEKGSVIENRHSGIPTMKREMKKMNLPEPEFIEERRSFKVIFKNNVSEKSQTGAQTGAQTKITGAQIKESNAQIYNNNLTNKLIEFCNTPKTMLQIMGFLGMKSKTHVRENIIRPLIKDDILEYTNKNNINARNQKYYSKRN